MLLRPEFRAAGNPRIVACLPWERGIRASVSWPRSRLHILLSLVPVGVRFVQLGCGVVLSTSHCCSPIPSERTSAQVFRLVEVVASENRADLIDGSSVVGAGVFAKRRQSPLLELHGRRKLNDSQLVDWLAIFDSIAKQPQQFA